MVKQGQLLYQIEQAPVSGQPRQRQGPVRRGRGRSDSATGRAGGQAGGLRAPVGADQEGRYLQDRLRPGQGRARRGQGRRRKGQGQRAAGQGAVESAEINLGYTTIKSPIDGRIGATAYTVGNLVDETSGTLATVVQLDPIRAVFSIPSADFVARMAGADRRRCQAQAARELRAAADPAHRRGLCAPGQDRLCRQSGRCRTGTVAIYADFPNPKHLLLPGQFINATVDTSPKLKEPAGGAGGGDPAHPRRRAGVCGRQGQPGRGCARSRRAARSALAMR
jgi:membrane fusion protein (multidrug efflux system)